MYVLRELPTVGIKDFLSYNINTLGGLSDGNDYETTARNDRFCEAISI